MAVLGNPLKRAVRLQFAGQTAFSPIGNVSLHFLESVGVALRYDVIFLLRNERYFHAVFHIFDSADEQQLDVHEHENDTNMERQKQLYLLMNCHQIRVVYRTSTEDQNHPWRTFMATLFLSSEVKIL